MIAVSFLFAKLNQKSKPTLVSASSRVWQQNEEQCHGYDALRSLNLDLDFSAVPANFEKLALLQIRRRDAGIS